MLRSNMLGTLSLCILTACSGDPIVATNEAGEAIGARKSVVSAPAANKLLTITDRTAARADNCRVRRALDGRVICTAEPQATRRTPVTPTVSTNTNKQPKAAPQTAAPSQQPGSAFAASGSFIVIGSFREYRNAAQWAEFNSEFGTRIQHLPETDMHRVLVGPLEDFPAALMQSILARAGVNESWAFNNCIALGDGQACAIDPQSPALAQLEADKPH